MTGERRRVATRWWRVLSLAAAVAGGIVAARGFGMVEWLSLDGLAHARQWIAGFGALAPLVFVGGYVVAVITFVPGVPLTLVGGMLFGPVWGTVYVSAASTLGACLAFLIARYAARDTVEQWVDASPILKRLDGAAARHGFRLVMVTRLVPLFPFNVQNYAYGITGIRFGTYALTSWVCMLPATVTYTLTGGALSEGDWAARALVGRLGLAAALLVCLSFVPGWLRGRSAALDELLKFR